MPVVISLPAATTAALIEQDLFAPGDALLTLDDVTGLQWLDLSATVDLSFDDILADSDGWLSMGFRHGTAGEVCDLLARNAIAPAECPGNAALQINDGGAAADAFHVFLGTTATNPNQAIGYFDDQTGGDKVGEAFLGNNGQSVVAVESDHRPRDLAVSTVGHYLVLIPEPSTAALLALGIVVIGVLGRWGRLA